MPADAFADVLPPSYRDMPHQFLLETTPSREMLILSSDRAKPLHEKLFVPSGSLPFLVKIARKIFSFLSQIYLIYILSQTKKYVNYHITSGSSLAK